MTMEILPESNLLAAFSQSKLNYLSPVYKPTQQTTETILADKIESPLNQPLKDEFIASTSVTAFQKSKNFVQKYGGFLTGSVALATSIIGLPLVYMLAKKGDTKLLGEIGESLSEVSKKLNNLDLDAKIQTAVKEAAKGLAKAENTPIISKQSMLTAALIGLGSGFGITEFLNGNKDKIKEQGYSDEDIRAAQSTATSIVEKPKEALNKANEVRGIANEARGVAYESRNIAYGMDNRINTAMETARLAMDTNSSVSPIMKLYTKSYYDLNLLTVRNYEKKIDLEKSREAIASIRNAALLRLDRSADETIANIKAYKANYPELASQWALTSEYDPIKKGGLGVVPVDLHNNFEKLGIDAPTFIPMYLKKNRAEFKQVTDNDGTHYEYKYDKNKFKLEKLAEIRIPVYRNGEQLFKKVEFYSTKLNIPDSDKTKTLIFVKNNDYYKDDLYDSSPLAEETEKFALFTKSVYTLAKYKVATALDSKLTGVENIQISNKEAFDELKAPNSMILNDWHAGSMAGLLRYRAPMEYAYNKVDEKVYKALKDMPLLQIGHNLGCQGKSNDGEGSIVAKNQVTENIINTLYGHYAIAIAENADSGIINNDNDDMCNTILMKRRTGDKHFNSLFNGVSLSDWFEIVSPNHAQECINDSKQSGILYPLLQRRQETGTIGGILNGLDKNTVNTRAVSTRNYVKGLTLESYDENTSIDEVTEKRENNKRAFYQQYLKPLMIDKTYEGGPEIVRPNESNTNISEEDFMNSPFIAFAHRLTPQKGLKHLKGAIFKLFDNWDELFPDKPMPIILAGGPPESASELVYLDELKNSNLGTNKARVDRTIALKGNLPNPAIMSAATFFIAPSDYEPCGLIQGECFAKGTPVIATKVGGFYDTIVDGKTGFLAEYPGEDAVYDKMVEALRMYFYNRESYKQMIADDLKVDFSWAQPNRKGSVYEYTDKMGFDRKRLPDIGSQRKDV